MSIFDIFQCFFTPPKKKPMFYNGLNFLKWSCSLLSICNYLLFIHLWIIPLTSLSSLIFLQLVKQFSSWSFCICSACCLDGTPFLSLWDTLFSLISFESLLIPYHWVIPDILCRTLFLSSGIPFTHLYFFLHITYGHFKYCVFVYVFIVGLIL